MRADIPLACRGAPCPPHKGARVPRALHSPLVHYSERHALRFPILRTRSERPRRAFRIQALKPPFKALKPPFKALKPPFKALKPPFKLQALW